MYLLLVFFLNYVLCQDVPVFDGNRAMDLLVKQCDFGPRFPGSIGHDKTKIFLESFLSRVSDTLLVMDENIPHPYKEDTLRLTNYLARFNNNSEHRIMLMAHWDTREFADKDEDKNKQKLPIIGANDGASGVAVLLVIAEVLDQLPLLNIGIDLLFIDGEDQGKAGDPDNFGLGTKAFSKKIPSPRPLYAICVDMVADKEQNFPIEQFSYRQAPWLVEEIWLLANNLGYSQFKTILGPAVMDDHYYLYKYAGIPSIDIIDFDYPNKKQNFWHTTQDIPENCSTESLRVVGDVLLHYIYIKDAEK